VGWYCREMSTSTRGLVVEEGGFEYDSDCYNDDLPYYAQQFSDVTFMRRIDIARQFAEQHPASKALALDQAAGSR
jgi:hypothetical protein